MKATADTQTHLSLVLEELIQHHGEDAVLAYRQNVKYANSQFKAFIWGLYHRLDRADREAITNNQGDPLVDQHIETALAKALRRYK